MNLLPWELCNYVRNGEMATMTDETLLAVLLEMDGGSWAAITAGAGETARFFEEE